MLCEASQPTVLRRPPGRPAPPSAEEQEPEEPNPPQSLFGTVGKVVPQGFVKEVPQTRLPELLWDSPESPNNVSACCQLNSWAASRWIQSGISKTQDPVVGSWQIATGWMHAALLPRSQDPQTRPCRCETCRAALASVVPRCLRVEDLGKLGGCKPRSAGELSEMLEKNCLPAHSRRQAAVLWCLEERATRLAPVCCSAWALAAPKVGVSLAERSSLGRW